MAIEQATWFTAGNPGTLGVEGPNIQRTANGNTWALMYAGDTTVTFWYHELSSGNMSTATGFSVTAGASTASFFIDEDDYAHVVYSNGTTHLYYRYGTPNAGRTSYTWGSEIALSTNAPYARPRLLVTYATLSGTLRKLLHVVGSHTVSGASPQVWYGRWFGTASSMTSLTAAAGNEISGMGMSAGTGAHNIVFDMLHNGDGKTAPRTTGATLFVALTHPQLTSGAVGRSVKITNTSLGNWSPATAQFLSGFTFNSIGAYPSNGVTGRFTGGWNGVEFWVGMQIFANPGGWKVATWSMDASATSMTYRDAVSVTNNTSPTPRPLPFVLTSNGGTPVIFVRDVTSYEFEVFRWTGSTWQASANLPSTYTNNATNAAREMTYNRSGGAAGSPWRNITSFQFGGVTGFNNNQNFYYWEREVQPYVPTSML